MKNVLLGLAFSIALVAPNGSLIAGSETYSSKNQASAPPAAEPFDWSGLYGGLNIGAVFSQHDLNINFEPALTSHPENTAVIGGGQLGVNLQCGHFVFGVEGDFQGSSDNSIAQFEFVNDSPDPIDRGSISFRRDISSNWFASARGRVGLAWNRFLIYATGGAAFTDLNVQSTDTFTDFTGTTVLSSDRTHTQVGWTVGGGAEYALSDHLSLGIEYRHCDFGTEAFPNPTPDRFHFTGFTHIDFRTD